MLTFVIIYELGRLYTELLVYSHVPRPLGAGADIFVSPPPTIIIFFDPYGPVNSELNGNPEALL